MPEKKFKIILAGGGTGGHIIPAIAVADEIIRRGGSVRFVGTKGRIEERLVPKAGYGLDFIKVRPLAGGGAGRKIAGLGSIPLSLIKSATLLKKLNPDAVIGVGGYVAGPVVMAARMMGIKTALLEQNATIGLANKLLKRTVHRAFVSYESTLDEFSAGRAVYTGNPVKQSIIDAAAKKRVLNKNRTSQKAVNILVMGGSQGAKSVDEKVPAAMYETALGSSVKILHQGQKENLDRALKVYKEAGIDAEVTPFIDDTAEAFLNADLIIARSGATTVSELTVMGLPAIFLPYPHHKDNQQYKNAVPMQKAGGAIVIDEKTEGILELSQAVLKFVREPEFFKNAQEASLQLGRPEAASDIVDGLQELIG